MTTIHTNGKIGEVRKALKQAAKTGGHYRVQVDMHAPDEHERLALIAMAQGFNIACQHDWVKGERWNRRMGEWHRNYRVPTYVPDPAYEARMAAWAARFTEHEALAA